MILFCWLIKILTVPLPLSHSLSSHLSQTVPLPIDQNIAGFVGFIVYRHRPDHCQHCRCLSRRGFHRLSLLAQPLSTSPLPFSSWVSWVSLSIQALGFIVESHRCLPHHGFRGFFVDSSFFFFSCWWWWLFVAVVEEKDWRFEFFFPLLWIGGGGGGCGCG